MDFTDKILRRASLKNVAHYVMCGEDCAENYGSTYKERIQQTYKEFEDFLILEDKEEQEILDRANEMASDIAAIYMELGMKAGMALMSEILCNQDGKEV